MPMHDFASIAREFSLTLMSVCSWDLVFISLAIEISEALSFSFSVRTVSLISCTSATILQKQNNLINNQFSDLSVFGTMQIYTTTIILTAKKEKKFCYTHQYVYKLKWLFHLVSYYHAEFDFRECSQPSHNAIFTDTHWSKSNSYF